MKKRIGGKEATREEVDAVIAALNAMAALAKKSREKKGAKQ